MRRLTSLAAVILCLAPATAVQSQTRGGRFGSCRPPASRDSIVLTAYVEVAPLDPTQHIDASFLDTWAIQVAQRVKLTGPLDLSVYGFDKGAGEPTDTASRAHLSFSGMYIVRVPRAGSPFGIAVLRTTLSRSLDSALMSAVHIASQSGAFHPLPNYLAGDTVALSVIVGATSAPVNDSIVPLFQFKSPRIKIDHLAQQARAGLGPRYPQEHQGSGVEGNVLVEFVVNEAGRAESRTVRVVHTSDALFLQSVLNYLPNARYNPAMSGGCPIALRAAQLFDFRNDDR